MLPRFLLRRLVPSSLTRQLRPLSTLQEPLPHIPQPTNASLEGCTGNNQNSVPKQLLKSVSFYRRSLPAFLISFNSQAGRQLFREALLADQVENFFDLCGNFTHQAETAYCGLSSLAMVLNALECDPGRAWKGVWRWYADEMLECCRPLAEIREKGLTFDQLACLAKCHGLQVQAHRVERFESSGASSLDSQPRREASSVDSSSSPGSTSLEAFREEIRRACTTPGLHMIVHYSRGSLEQTGDGHFSPIGAYHAERDLVLVLDVARFKYPSYWVSVERLWEAMHPVDAETGLSRGWLTLRRQQPRFTGCE